MKIHELYIKNFKGFEEKTFRLNPHFTVLIGDNATGKTTVLDALAVAIGSFFIDMEEVVSRTIQPKEIRVITINGQPKPQKPVIIAAKGELDGNRLEWKRDIEKLKTSKKNAKNLRTLVNKKIERSRKPNHQETFPIIVYYSTARLWAEHEQIGYQIKQEGINMAYRNCLSLKSSSKDFLSWYKTQEDTTLKFNQALDLIHLKVFKETIISLLPPNKWKDIAFDRGENELVGIFTDDQNQDHRLKYSQLSDGFRNIIGLAADIAYRCIQLNPHLGENAVKDTEGIVLIDEIDLHLHPKWQRHIVGDLKRIFPNIQFVATTHSPFIVQSLKSDELVNLENEYVDSNPSDLSLNQVVSEIMQVHNLRSDNFEDRFQIAVKSFEHLQQKEDLTLDNYEQLKKIIDGVLIQETSDPVYKAFLHVTQRN